MASDVEKTLEYTSNNGIFLSNEEYTLPGNEALLLAYVRYIHEEIMAEEMLFARTLVTDKNGDLSTKSWKISFKKTKFRCIISSLCQKWGACNGW